MFCVRLGATFDGSSMPAGVGAARAPLGEAPLAGDQAAPLSLREARRHLNTWSWLKLVVGNGEMIPLPDASQDAVTNVLMVHELPSKVRQACSANLHAC